MHVLKLHIPNLNKDNAQRFEDLATQTSGVEGVDTWPGRAEVALSEPSLEQSVLTKFREAGFEIKSSDSDIAADVVTEASKSMKVSKVRIAGMTCRSCELTIERKFKKIPGVQKVDVNAAGGVARIVCDEGCEPKLSTLQQALGDEKYTVQGFHESKREMQQNRRAELEAKPSFWRLIGVFAAVIIAIKIFSGLGLSDLAGSIGGNTTFFSALLIGLLAGSSSCIAVAGGLLLSSAKKFRERYGEGTFTQRMKPVFLFAGGRVLSYAVLGGVIGSIGKALNPSPKVTGLLVLIAAVYMIIMGLDMLHIAPAWLKRFMPRMPKSLGHRVLDAEEKDHPFMPAVLGAATFFLPCGFTQALQIYALSTKSFVTGAMVLGGFAIGTAPMLIGLGAAATSLKGKAGKLFFQFSGALVIVLGVWNMGNGLTLTGHSISWPSFSSAASAAGNDANVKIVDGKQVIDMKVDGLGYSPSHFTIRQGIPVEWRVDGTKAGGCAAVLTVPSLGLTEYLPKDSVKTIEFTPQQVGKISFSCPMGMTTWGAGFDVVSNDSAAAQPNTANTVAAGGSVTAPCNTGNCQKVTLTVSPERGFYPKQFTVKKGIPVEMDIDATIQPGGCMGTLLVPKYNIAHQIALGTSSFTFTPTEAGDVPYTCAMGIRMGSFTVTD